MGSKCTTGIALIFSDERTCVFTSPPVLPRTRRALMEAANEKRAEIGTLAPGQCVCMIWTPLTGWMVEFVGESSMVEKEEMQMSKEIQVFSFEDRETRVTMVKGEPWIVAKDVADALGYNPDSKMGMLFKHVPEEWKGVNRIYTPGGSQKMLCLSEQGLYFFLGRSDKPKALPYQRWIAGEVVPSIRKTGEYATPAAKKRKADKDDELALRRIEVMEKNADYRMAKLILEGIDKFKDVMTPESKIVFMAKYGELTAKHDMMHMLPPATEKWYSATELGTEFGVSAQQIGKTANENDLKAPEGESNQYGTWIRSKSQHSSREVMTWVYYEAAREWFARYFKERKTA